MTKYLVTGSSGYIGSRVINSLKENNLEYIGIDKICEDSSSDFCLNLRDRDSTIKLLNKTKPSIIIHCGTFSALPYRDNLLKSYSDDSNSLLNILEFLSRNPEVRLVYFSSSYVYSGISKNIECDENQILKPQHNFGICKNFFEEMILRNHENSVIFRLSSVFGPGNQLQPNAIKNMIAEAFKDNKLDVWGKGNRKMQYVYVEDVVNYVLNSYSFPSGIYNLGSKDYVSISDAAKIITSHTSSSLNYLSDKKEGETLPFMLIDKLVNVSSENVPRSFKSALVQYIDSFR